jgi:thioredoxin reductase
MKITGLFGEDAASKSPRDIAIVGAGPAGVAAADEAVLVGLKPIVIEATSEVGGQAKFAAWVEDVPGVEIAITGKQLLASYRSGLRQPGIDLKLNTRVVNMTYDEQTGLKTLALSNGDRIH